jgi:hypothetical protein
MNIRFCFQENFSRSTANHPRLNAFGYARLDRTGLLANTRLSNYANRAGHPLPAYPGVLAIPEGAR